MWSGTVDFYPSFISYSLKDKVFVQRPHDALPVKGIRCWLDEHQHKLGDDIHICRSVDRGIRIRDKVLLCCSQTPLDSWWVDREIDTAIRKEKNVPG